MAGAEFLHGPLGVLDGPGAVAEEELDRLVPAGTDLHGIGDDVAWQVGSPGAQRVLGWMLSVTVPVGLVCILADLALEVVVAVQSRQRLEPIP